MASVGAMTTDRCAGRPDLPEGVGAALIRASRAHRALAASLLADLGLHPGQEVLTFLLEGGPRSPGELAAALWVEPPTVTKMVQRMERAGLVERSPSLTDRRVQLIDLTSAGRDAAAAARAMGDRLEAVSADGLTDRQRAELERLLTRSAEGIEAALAARGGTPTC